MRRRANRTALLAPLLIAMTSACSSEARLPVVPVRGKVTFAGAPVTKGSITFQPIKDGPLANGVIQPDGSYKLSTYAAGEGDGAALGDYNVSIIANDGDPSKMPGTPGYVPPKQLVPARYNDPGTSGLKATVTGKDDVIDFTLN